MREILGKCPDSLFKYKQFGKNTFDILKKGYAYLSPTKNLDDPFDCLSDFDTTKIINPDTKTITDQFLKHIIKKAKEKNISVDDKQVGIAKEYKTAFKQGDDFETDRIYECLKNNGVPENQIGSEIVRYKNLVNLSDTFKDVGVFEQFANVLMNSRESIKVCSLSEINDNKVMWSLYGKEYEGCCIEYCFKLNNKPPRFLFPVIYSRKANNNFTEKMFDMLFAELDRHMFEDIFHFNKEIGDLGAIYELFCTKDIDWRYQKEWRLVSTADEKCYDVVIKAVYLGFKVAKTNEDKMIRYAKRYKYSLYKMKAPDGKKRIRFTKLV